MPLTTYSCGTSRAAKRSDLRDEAGGGSGSARVFSRESHVLFGYGDVCDTDRSCCATEGAFLTSAGSSSATADFAPSSLEGRLASKPALARVGMSALSCVALLSIEEGALVGLESLSDGYSSRGDGARTSLLALTVTGFPRTSITMIGQRFDSTR